MSGFHHACRPPGVDHCRVLELEELIAMDEGGGIGPHAVVGAAPWHEVQLAGLAGGPARQEVLHQRGGGLGGQRPLEVLRLGKQIGRLRRSGVGTVPSPVLPDRQFGPELPCLWKDNCVADAQVGSEPARTTSPSSSCVASDAVPSSAPYTSMEAGWPISPATVSFRLAASSSGPAGAHPCQASMRAAARASGHTRWTFVASGAGTVRNTSDVTTPKLPAPAPRSAQNRSSSWCSSQSRTRPSARTITAAIR